MAGGKEKVSWPKITNWRRKKATMEVNDLLDRYKEREEGERETDK